MDPAQAVRADVELPGVIADDDGVGQEAMRLDTAPQGTLGGDHDRIGVDFESRDAESVEMCGPGRHRILFASCVMWRLERLLPT